MNFKQKKDLIQFLETVMLEERIELIEKNVNERTRYVTVVLENIFQPQNASAVMRSCDCFGVQDLHVIENSNKYEINPDVVMGSSKWIDLKRYNFKDENTLDAINSLKKEGYRIVATTPHTNDVLLPDFDLTKGKSAFFFGTERRGLSDVVMDHADEFVKIPMYGFTESFNISVSASLVLSHLASALRRSDVDWQLTEEEKLDLKLEWYKRSIKSSEKMIERFKKHL
ncbi:TrmH family RNA methyltransferase [Ancylomarina euxinus]|uniref:tRNA (guanosine(18)-2'-O)-methyltransferase n=1 Tax=Ancylomarina euxinus TaxID=2283627 RepID=A0A425XXG0_9BACT|nr:RNA methyltransferase [Ancylomarina euxinus]MCZ4696088.1 RNA methyltransferase [Ancylomarina euxinus]MUP16497.1 TrmH family RNA methyltransferase [Ancylomarina euxinus]RRG19351.1 TrmH family RNA methyltransferase [Ancylomarina euxinus]